MQEGLEGLPIIKKEEQPTASACQKTQTTYSSLLECKAPIQSVGLSAVCYTSARITALMIPAKTRCPPSWTHEYTGYLMAEAAGHHRSMFECIDKDPESVPGSATNVDGALFYHTEATCSGLPCPPYDAAKELTCVMCTK